MPHPLRSSVAERAAYRCEYCTAPEEPSPDEFEVEHIEPASRGGADDLGNLALSCRSCNKYKSAATYVRDADTGETVPLFHPRKHVWDDHFYLDPRTLEIVGQTPIGRATVRRLRMNRPKARQARAHWLLWLALTGGTLSS